ncbi:MAG: hypothetical protein K6U74_20995, partial [Firmicutes bacterium]|nr:hypothetical protein [Bacillota bacterium]
MQALFEEIAHADFSRLSWPESGREQVMEVLQFLLSGSLTERRKREREEAEPVKLNDLAWVFVTDGSFRPQPVRTWSTFDKKLDGGMIYFTPNTFYSRKSKTANALRWLNTVFVDIDDPHFCDLDVLDRCSELGLARPSLIVKTPHGLHVYFKIKRV